MPTEYTTTGMRMEGRSIMSAPVEAEVRTNPVAENLSGIMINQNGAYSGSISMLNEDFIWQTFRFPADYPRGISGGANIAIPRLCGFHICTEVETNHGPAAGLDWVIDYWHPIRGWVGVVKGTEVGSPGDGPNVWYDVNFTPIDITDFWYRKFRLGVCGRVGDPAVFRIPVAYNERTNKIILEEEEISVIPTISPAPLVDGKTYWFRNSEGKPAIIEMLGEDAYYSEQHGMKSVAYTAPNPYAGSSTTEYVSTNKAAAEGAEEDFTAVQEGIPNAVPKATGETTLVTVPRVVGSDIKAYQKDGVNALVSEGREVSLRFRILSTAPDSDRDCTGSLYRTVAIVKDPETIRSSVGELEDAYWLSAPNPSKFACESLYLDTTSFGEAQVIDHIMIDPVTPGIYMNMYYSNDPVAGVDTDTWDSLLWTKIPKTFLLRRRESFTLPEPITAKFVKLEFTHLQPVWYSAGTFQLPTKYRKHPKWVMDYYLSIYEHVRAQELESAPTVNVSYNALDLAYNYYLDDLRQGTPNFPETVESAEGVSLLTNFLTKEQTSEESTIDPTTLLKIKTSMRPYLTQPSQQGNFESLLQKIIGPTANIGNYPTEATGTALTGSATEEVSTLERDSLIVEKQFPVTSFYLTCRHYYMHSEAYFEEERAYFAGIKEVSLTREHYTSVYDHDIYLDNGGDNANINNNDLYAEDHTWVTYQTNE